MSEVAADNIVVPKIVLFAAAAAMLVAVALAGASHATGYNHIVLPPTSAVESRDLLFKDLPTGGIDITDARSGQPVATVLPTTGGFMRGVMRSLVFEHRLNEQATGTAFRLTRWADGRLSIEDPKNGMRFELEAFGATNEAAFARLLASQSADDAVPANGAVKGTWTR